MRHGRKIHKLERPKAHREALISNLANALITHKKIRTTEAKAKALKPVIDRLITTAKQNTVHARRLVAKTVRNKETVKKLFDEIAPEMLDRTSGYSRMVRVGTRHGDGAEIVLVELMLKAEEPEEKGKKGRKKRGLFKGKPKASKSQAVKGTAAPAEEPVEEAAAEEVSVEPEEKAADAEAIAEPEEEKQDDESVEQPADDEEKKE